MSFLKFPIYKVSDPVVKNHLNDKRLVACVRADVYNVEEKELLRKILSATGIDKDDMSIEVFFDAHTFQFSDCSQNQLVISFGVRGIDIGLQCDDSKYKLLRIENNHFLFADPLNQIKSDPKLKKSLWAVLKSYFEI